MDRFDFDDLCRKILDADPAYESGLIRLINDYVSSTTCTLTALCHTSKRPFATNLFGATILHIVCERGLIKVFDHILDLCSDPILLNQRMSDGATALFLANINRLEKSEEKSLYMTTVLVDRGADMTLTRSRYNATPFHIACEQGYLESAKFLLRVMLERGFSVRDIAFRTTPACSNPGPISVLQSCVYSGLHSRVCEWLTSGECKVLWPGGCLRDFVRHLSSDGHTALTLALSAMTISMDNIRRLVDSGALREPNADHIFRDTQTRTSLLTQAMKNSHHRTRLDLEEQLLEYLFEQALQPRDEQGYVFDERFPPDCTLLQIVRSNYLSSCLDHTNMLVRVIRKLLVAYPHVFTEDYVQKCKTKMSEGFRLNTAAILLDWYPYEPFQLSRMLTELVPGPIVIHYMRQFIAHHKKFNLNVQTLYRALLHSPEVWEMALSFLLTTNPDPSQFLVELARIVDEENSLLDSSIQIAQIKSRYHIRGEFSIRKVRLLYHVHKKFPGSLKSSLVQILQLCSPEVAPSLCWHMLVLVVHHHMAQRCETQPDPGKNDDERGCSEVQKQI